jgi:hypothetical protein
MNTINDFFKKEVKEEKGSNNSFEIGSPDKNKVHYSEENVKKESVMHKLEKNITDVFDKFITKEELKEEPRIKHTNSKFNLNFVENSQKFAENIKIKNSQFAENIRLNNQKIADNIKQTHTIITENLKNKEEQFKQGTQKIAEQFKMNFKNRPILPNNQMKNDIMDGFQKLSLTLKTNDEKRRTGPIRKSTKGGWTTEEDETLRESVIENKGKNWKKISEKLTDRTAIQCLHRYN